MTSSASIRQKLTDLSTRRADLEKKIGTAHQVKSRKESEAAARTASATRSSSPSTQRMYLRQADTARDAALREGKKIADLMTRLAGVARDEGQRHTDLASAVRSEASAQIRADDRARRDPRRPSDDRGKRSKPPRSAASASAWLTSSAVKKKTPAVS